MFLATLNQQQKETFLCLAHNVVVSDGELCTGERAMLADMRIEMAIDNDYEAHYLPVQGLAQLFDQHRSRVIVLMSLIQLGHADNAYEIEERCVITELATEFSIPASELQRIENWVERLIALQDEAFNLL